MIYSLIVSFMVFVHPFFLRCAFSNHREVLMVPIGTPSPDPSFTSECSPFKSIGAATSCGSRSPLYDGRISPSDPNEFIDSVKAFYRCGVGTSPSRLHMHAVRETPSSIEGDGRSRVESDASRKIKGSPGLDGEYRESERSVFFQDPEDLDTCLHKVARVQSIAGWKYFSQEVVDFEKLFYMKNKAGNIAAFEFILSPELTHKSFLYIIDFCKNLKKHFTRRRSEIVYRREFLETQNNAGKTFLHLIASSHLLSEKEKEKELSCFSGGFPLEKAVDNEGKTAWDYLGGTED